MDKKEEKPDWSWLPNKMPRIVELMREKRKAYGNAHVDECWRRGVLNAEPGWFFAREGALAVGTPIALCDELDALAAAQGFMREPMLMLREPAGYTESRGSDGAN